MKFIKKIYHPLIFIASFTLVSLLSLIPNGLGWRHRVHGINQEYLLLYILYIAAFFLGYLLFKKPKAQLKKEISKKDIKRFKLLFFISLGFFLVKFIYIGGIPLTGETPYLRTRVSQLGGFVDYPTKLLSLCGIMAFYFFVRLRIKTFLVYTFIAILMNILFAERSLLVFIILGSLILYLRYNPVSTKIFTVSIILGFSILFLISFIQISRHGGRDSIDLTGKRSLLEITAWIVHGDLTGSQKFGAYVTKVLDNKNQSLNGRYTFGNYLSIFIPGYGKEHGAEYLKKYNKKNVRSAQSAAIPFSYYIDFGYLSVFLVIIIGLITRYLYGKFKHDNSPYFNILYIIFVFNLYWSLRAGIFPLDTKFVYYSLALLFVFKLDSKFILNKHVILWFRILFLLSVVLSTIVLIKRL